MMGGNQSSSQKGNIADVFKYFDEELERWTTTKENLRQTWDKGDRSWVPGYLYNEMEETEKRWKKIKSIIIPPRKDDRKIEEDPLQGNIPCNYQDIIQQHNESMKNMKKNNETLLQKNQCLEKQLADLRQALSKKDQQGPPSRSNPSKPADKQPIQPDASFTSSSSVSVRKERNSIAEQILNLPENEFLKKMIDKESKWEDDKEALEGIITKLEKENIELKSRLAEHIPRPGSGTQPTGKQQNEKQQENLETALANETNTGNEAQVKLTSAQEEIKNLAKKNKELQDEIDKLGTEMQKLTSTSEDRNEKGRRYQQSMTGSVKTDQEKGSVKDSHEEKLRNKCHDNFELREQIDILKAEKESLEMCARQLGEEKEELLLRLSRFASEKLVQNNPAITDLSDPNRPTKLAEYYSELYDNEWTNAFVALESAGYDESTAIKTLRVTLENALQFCEEKAGLLLRKVSDAVNLLFNDYQESVLAMEVPSHLTMPRQNVGAKGKYLPRENSSLDEIKLQRMWKPKREKDGPRASPENVKKMDTNNHEAENKLQTLRKEMASTMVPIVQKAYIEASWTNGCIDEIKPYILKCLYLGWMMEVQTPPMVFHKCELEVDFDRNLYKEYVTSGPKVNYIVWPALLLHEDGPIVCKGVAEGTKSPQRQDKSKK